MPSNNDAVMRCWPFVAIAALGVWLLLAPLTFPPDNHLLAFSDVVSGLLLIALAFTRQFGAIALVGLWLQFAPLLFWETRAVSYLNDTLIGVMVWVSLLLLNSAVDKDEEDDLKPIGWSYNPSAWPQRFLIAFLSFLAWTFARYMASYQLGYTDDMWDPVFGDGTRKVITSKISRQFPLPDAGLGALAYTAEAFMTLHGGSGRWHRIPWFVLLWALLVIPLGFVSIVLIMLQPIAVGFWCFWCLLCALCMLSMIALAFDEVVAVFQNLYAAKKAGFTLSDIFWNGTPWWREAAVAAAPQPSSPQRTAEGGEPIGTLFHGITWRWNMILAALIGIWIMFSPTIIDRSEGVAIFDHIIGALTVACAIICLADLAVTLRFFLIALGVLLLALSGFASHYAIADHLFSGLALILLVSFRPTTTARYGPSQSLVA